MSDMWESLGFQESPYDARPLRPVAPDAELLVGREREAIDLCTALESAREGIMVLSGPPGVGKTSFFNVQQFRMSTETSAFGPKLLPAERLCSIFPKDTPRTIALRVVETLVKSVQIACASANKRVPPETEKVSKWISQSGGGFEVGIQILGFGGNIGRSTILPSVDNISFEGLHNAIECIIGEVVDVLQFEGAFLALDNIENLDDEELKMLLISLRDNLFMIPCVWWILIGQSGLGSLIQALDPRISDRVEGATLELKPLTFEELEDAVALRVKRFCKDPDARSPLPREVHKRLYDVSHGEIRFVFKYSQAICTKFVQALRQQIRKADPGKDFYLHIADTTARLLINKQIPAARAEELVKEIVILDFNGLNLRSREKEVLRLLANKGYAIPKEYKEFGVETQLEFETNYIDKLHMQNLLERRQQGEADCYRLRGIALLAHEFGLV
jgi:Cdc6-like AAA superfamily ATPase